MTALFKYDAQKHQSSRNYLIFLLALTALILIPGLINYLLPDKIFTSQRVFAIFYMFTILTGVYTVTDNLKNLTFGIVMGVLSLITAFLRFEYVMDAPWFGLANFVINLTFFSFLLVKCLQEVLKQGAVDLKTIYAALCGFLILGLNASIILNFVNGAVPDAFSVAIPSNDYFSMLYFSFVTLTTLGYGDISPVHPIARSIAMIIAIFGQLYLTVLIAILVGKFVSQPRESGT